MAESKDPKPAHKFIIKFHGVGAWFSGDIAGPLADRDMAKRFSAADEAYHEALPVFGDGFCIEPVVK